MTLVALAAACAPATLEPELLPPEREILPPGELAAEVALSADAAPGLGGDVREVSAIFAEAVEDYGLAVQRLLTFPAGGTDEQRIDAALLLARALRRAPGAGPEIDAAADALARAALGKDPPRLQGALRIAADALTDLARGPYEGAPDVLARVRELRATIAALPPPAAAAPAEPAINEALRSAELALKAMLRYLGSTDGITPAR